MQTACWLLLCLGAAVSIGHVSAGMGTAASSQIALLIALLLPSLTLAVIGSRHLVTYLLLVWAVGPEIRRVSDWLSGEYASVSLLSLSPLLCSSMLLIPVLVRMFKLRGTAQKIVAFLAGGLAYATLIGLMKNGSMAIYDLANYLMPMLLVPYMLTNPFDKKALDSWMRAFSTIAVLVAMYGIYQYLSVPPWDKFWMEHVEMGSIGRPEPLEIRVFSTLNSPGPAAFFLAFALGPMIMEKRWRGIFGWIGVAAVTICLLTTMVRSAWLMLVVWLFVFIATSAKQNRNRSLLQLAFVVAVAIVVVPRLPGAEQLVGRLETLTELEQDHSYNERQDILQTLGPMLASNPDGLGLGSTGTSSKLGNDGSMGELGVVDNGFLSLMLTFGIVGSLLLFASLYLLGKMAALTRSRAERLSQDLYARLALAALLSAVAGLLSDNVFTGIKGFVIWALIGIGLGATERLSARKEGDTHAAAPNRIKGQPVQVHVDVPPGHPY
ncbi:MAG: hypothetical protein K0R57_4238 [Paenibacillaceae bacterium]|nr:hypothetical protein [Paenibacillaceae bacterium]